MTSKWVGVAGAITASIAAAACGGSVGPDPTVERETVVELPATVNRDLDLLFVVDDSVGMLEVQQNLAVSLPVLFDRLQRLPGGLPNLHLGVVSTDMGTLSSGSSVPAPAIGQVGVGGCAGAGKNGVLQTHVATMVNGTFLLDVAQTDGTRLKNYDGDLATTLGLMMRGGAGGCGFEQPLAAMRAALGGQPANAGFLRPDALLGVVLVTDEDDCSAASSSLFAPSNGPLGALASFRCTRFGVTCTIGGATPEAMNQPGMKSECGPSPSSTLLDDVATFRDFLLGLKRDPGQVIVAGIMAPAEPFQVELRPPPGGGNAAPALVHACTVPGPTGSVIADPAARLQGFLDGFPDRSTAAPVCPVDQAGGVAKIGGLLARAIGSPCVDGVLADTDPDESGVQIDCIVEDLVGAAATEIEQCDASERAPCWKLEEDAASCAAPGNLKLSVVRGGEPAPETVTRMRCAVAP